MVEFSKEKINRIKGEIDRCLDSGAVDLVAAFDADGTLWNTDMGENFFKYQIRENLLPNLPEEPWEYYMNMHNNISVVESFLWLAQINAGLPIEQVRAWADQAMAELGTPPIFSAQKEIVDHLHKQGVETYIVTASIQWAVEPGAKFYDIPKENVIGVRTRIDNGLVTDEQEGAITYREGKVTGLLERIGQRRPFFCAGNTQGDLPLLESSSNLRLVIAAESEDGSNFESEQRMQTIARDNGWFQHSYR